MTELTLPELDRTAAVPWWKYLFEGPNGRVSLAELFDHRARLAVYHPMPDRSGASDVVPTAEIATTLAEPDVRLVLVSRAPYAKLEQYRRHFGRNLAAYSAVGAGFTDDFPATRHVPSAVDGPAWDDDGAGLSFFHRERGSVRHTGSIALPHWDFLGLLTVTDAIPAARGEH